MVRRPNRSQVQVYKSLGHITQDLEAVQAFVKGGTA
jgi:hypothetical protein